MKRIILSVFVLCATLGALAQKSGVVKLNTPADSVSYIAGFVNSNGLASYLQKQFDVNEKDLPKFVEAFKEAVKKINDKKTQIMIASATVASQIGNGMIPQIKNQVNSAKIDDDLVFRGLLDGLMQDSSVIKQPDAQKYFKNKLAAEKEAKEKAMKAEGTEWLAKNAKKSGVKTLPSGLQYKVITEGNGPIPTKDQTVTVKYEGKLINGTVFDSSYTRNPQTTDFKPTQVIKGWTEALTMMPVGSTWELYIPENLAYGAQQKGKIPAYSTLIFKVELVGIK